MEKKVLMILFSMWLVVLISVSVLAQGEGNILQQILEPLVGTQTIGNIYNKYYSYIDFVIYLILFIPIIQIALQNRFGDATRRIAIALGIVFALSLTVWGNTVQFKLSDLGPIVWLILGFFIAIIFFHLVRTVLEIFGLRNNMAAIFIAIGLALIIFNAMSAGWSNQDTTPKNSPRAIKPFELPVIGPFIKNAGAFGWLFIIIGIIIAILQRKRPSQLVRDVGGEIKETGRALKETGGDLKKVIKGERKLEGVIEEQERTLEEIRKTINKINRAAEGGEKRSEEIVKLLQRLARQFNKLKKEEHKELQIKMTKGLKDLLPIDVKNIWRKELQVESFLLNEVDKFVSAKDWDNKQKILNEILKVVEYLINLKNKEINNLRKWA